jgi:hypothetical protein
VGCSKVTTEKPLKKARMNYVGPLESWARDRSFSRPKTRFPRSKNNPSPGEEMNAEPAAAFAIFATGTGYK